VRLYNSYRAGLNYAHLLAVKTVRRHEVSSLFEILASVSASSHIIRECRHNVDVLLSQLLFHLRAMRWLKEEPVFFLACVCCLLLSAFPLEHPLNCCKHPFREALRHFPFRKSPGYTLQVNVTVTHCYKLSNRVSIAIWHGPKATCILLPHFTAPKS